MYHGLSAVDFETFFERDIDSWTRGHTLKLKKGRVATDLRHHFFTERIVNTWNHLDVSVVEAETLNTFKSMLQRMYDSDESFLGRTTSYWLQRPSQSPWGGLIWWVIQWVIIYLHDTEKSTHYILSLCLVQINTNLLSLLISAWLVILQDLLSSRSRSRSWCPKVNCCKLLGFDFTGRHQD